MTFLTDGRSEVGVLEDPSSGEELEEEVGCHCVPEPQKRW